VRRIAVWTVGLSEKYSPRTSAISSAGYRLVPSPAMGMIVMALIPVVAVMIGVLLAVMRFAGGGCKNCRIEGISLS
jgi:hypothetical protein